MGLTITLADILEEELRVMELFEEERQKCGSASDSASLFHRYSFRDSRKQRYVPG